jgi:hypothetical protein
MGRILIALTLSSCASPKTPGIASIGTRTGDTMKHLATGEAKILALFDFKVGMCSYVLPAGPLTFTPLEIDGRPIITGTSKP